MNFFGHAAVASWRSTDPDFVLGAMLPDFASMIRARPPKVELPALLAGIELHHATDEVFHEASAFRELTAQAFEALSSAGLHRGSARAVAHIGVEILLDGVLADQRSARQAYLAAIARETGHRPEVAWRSEPEALAFGALLDAMCERGVSRQHASPAIVALRVERALAGRTRLALRPGEARHVERWAEATRHAVRDRAPNIVAELSRKLPGGCAFAKPVR